MNVIISSGVKNTFDPKLYLGGTSWKCVNKIIAFEASSAILLKMIKIQ